VANRGLLAAAPLVYDQDGDVLGRKVTLGALKRLYNPKKGLATQASRGTPA